MDSKDEIRVWGIHNTRDENLFLQDSVIAIGWEEMGELSAIENSRDAFKSALAKTYSGSSKMSIAINGGQLYRFVYEARIGDYVVFPSKFDRKINIGIIESDYFYLNP